MKAQKLTTAFRRIGQAFLVSLLAAWVAGCRTTGYTKGDTTAHSLQQASFEVNSESRALELTLHTLDDLVNKPGADLKPQYKRFSEALDWLISSAARNDRADREVSEKGVAYFQAWDRAVTNMQFEVIREASSARKSEAINDFQSVHHRYVEAQTVMRPLLSYLEDIRKALSADLTQRGLEALKPIVANADDNAGKVHVALNRLTNELTVSGARLSSFAYQTQGQPVTPTGTNSGRETLEQ